MPDYEKMYFLAARKIADTIEALDALSVELKIVQLQGEEMYIEDNESTGQTEPPPKS